jgi:hypothetical protein
VFCELVSDVRIRNRVMAVFSQLLRKFIEFAQLYIFLSGARGSVVGGGTRLQAGRSPVRVPDEVDFFFQFTQFFQPHYGPGVDSASDRNEYQESSWG